MPESKSRFVLVCQQAFACAVVAAVGVSAVGVVELEIIAPDRQSVQALGSGSVAFVSSEPVEATVRTVPLGGSAVGGSTLRPKSDSRAGDPQEIRVVSEPEPVDGFATVGVTWADGQELTEDEVVVELRTLEGGTWSEWQEMHFDPAHQPDPGTEGTRVREGTDAVVIGDVEDVQVRAVSETGSSPEGLALAIVDPGEDESLEEVEAAPTTSGSTSAPTYSEDGAVLQAGMKVAPKPKIFTRKDWGADERLRDSGSLRYGEIHAAFVHHTVNANDYSKEQVPSVLRGIYAYHTKSRGWSDVGYNFLVDRFGQIWEGRYGGVDRPVIGAHTLGYNEEAFAMSAIGNFDVAQPSAAMVKAYGQLFAWKLSLHGIAANDAKQWVDDRYLPAINGHRDAGSTACPGRYLYAKLGEIRKQATAIQQGATNEPPTPPEPEEPKPEEPPAPEGPGSPLDANISGSEWPDLVVRDKETKHAVVIRTLGQLGFEDGTTAAGPWKRVERVTAPGDLDGDGLGDLVVQKRPGAEPKLLLGAEDGTVHRSATTFPRFARLDSLTGVGDFDSDGDNDLAGRRADTGELLLFRGRGDGTFGGARQLAADWTRYDVTTGVDDVDGDGRPDLVARSGATLYLVPGLDGRKLGAPVAMPGTWDGYDVISGRGDVTGDDVPDLLVRSAESGLTFVHPGDGAGGWTPALGGWTTQQGADWLAIAGQMAGSRQADLVGVDGDLRVRVFPNTGRRNVGEPIDTGVVLDGIDMLLNVGDWNGDGRGDVMTRVAATGELQLRPGRRGNRFGGPVSAGTGWDKVSRIAAVGDVNGDGHPDLAGRAADGTDRLFPGDGARGFKASYVARSVVPGKNQVGLGLWDADTMPDTALRRTDGTLWVWLSQRSKTLKVLDGLRRYDWVQGLGDLDGDERADLVVRARKNGNLYLLPGRSDGFAPRRLIATGFEGYDYAG